jgi:hypothetical protein
MDTVELATITEARLHDLLDHPSQTNTDGFSLDGARLYGIVADGEEEPLLTLLGSHKDVYELLESNASIKAKSGYKYVGIVTTGWAAPLSDNGEVEGAPSAHPMRRRVRLMVVAHREGVASVLRFQDEPDEPITDPGSATGSLAEAVLRFVEM